MRSSDITSASSSSYKWLASSANKGELCEVPVPASENSSRPTELLLLDRSRERLTALNRSFCSFWNCCTRFHLFARWNSFWRWTRLCLIDSGSVSSIHCSFGLNITHLPGTRCINAWDIELRLSSGKPLVGVSGHARQDRTSLTKGGDEGNMRRNDNGNQTRRAEVPEAPRSSCEISRPKRETTNLAAYASLWGQPTEFVVDTSCEV